MINMPRILYVTEAFGGGVFVLISLCCNFMVERGFEVHLCYSLRWDTFQPLEKYFDPRVTLHHIPMVRNINFREDGMALINLVRLFRRIDPDVIHLFSSKAGFLGRLAALAYGRRVSVFYSPQGLAFLQQEFSAHKRMLFLALENLAFFCGGKIVASCQSEADIMARYMPLAKTIIIENAIDTEGLIQKNDQENAKVTIGTAGRIKAQKDPVTFARLAKNFSKQGISAVWIGDGDHPGREALIEAGVEVTGMLSREAWRERLAGLDIYVQTSLWEGMPLAMIEALIAGIPAVVTNVVGNRDVVEHGESGFIAHNIEEMQAYICLLIEDVALRHQMGKRARERSYRRFHFDRFADELFSAYTAG